MGRQKTIAYDSLHVRFSTEQKAHIVRHAKRLGFDLSDLVREGVRAYLKILDEEEIATLHARNLRKQALVPSVPQHRNNEIPTLRKQKMMRGSQPPISFASAAHTQISEKLQRSFPRWAEYIEEAEDRIDADRRAKVVLDEMRDRAVSEIEVTACFDRFKDFLSDRKNARATPSHVVDVSKMSMIAGDIAD